MIKINHNKALFTIWLLGFACLFPDSNAHAYLDTGTGSYLIQVFIGVFFGAGYVIKTFSHQIRGVQIGCD